MDIDQLDSRGETKKKRKYAAIVSQLLRHVVSTNLIPAHFPQLELSTRRILTHY